MSATDIATPVRARWSHEHPHAPHIAVTSAREALDTLAHQLSVARQDELVRDVIADLVTELETLAQASLGPTARDATVVLLRRFARAHGRLLAESAGLVIDQSWLADYARAVRDPAAALQASCHLHAGAGASASASAAA